jgi:hypothetical protein
LHNFTFGATLSLGVTGAAITGIKYGVSRLVNGLVRDLFREDAPALYRDLLAYAEPELETLESPSAWIDRLAVEALSAHKFMPDLDQAALAKAPRCGPASQGSSNQRPRRGARRASQAKRRSNRPSKRHPPAC